MSDTTTQAVDRMAHRHTMNDDEAATLRALAADRNAIIAALTHAILGKTATQAAAAVLELVGPKPLVWEKSHIPSWNGDFHTLPTNYTIRCEDENGWKWYCIGRGAFGWNGSPEAAKAAAQAHADAAHWANTKIGGK